MANRNRTETVEIVSPPRRWDGVKAFLGSTVALLVIVLMLLGVPIGFYIRDLHTKLNAKSSDLASVETKYATYVKQSSEYTKMLETKVNGIMTELKKIDQELAGLIVRDEEDLKELEKLVTNLEKARDALIAMKNEYLKLLDEMRANKQKTDVLEQHVAGLEGTIGQLNQHIHVVRGQAATALARARAAEAATAPFGGGLLRRLLGGG